MFPHRKVCDGEVMLTRSNRKYDRFLNSEQLSSECQCLTCGDIHGDHLWWLWCLAYIIYMLCECRGYFCDT